MLSTSNLESLKTNSHIVKNSIILIFKKKLTLVFILIVLYMYLSFIFFLNMLTKRKLSILYFTQKMGPLG